MQLHLQATLIQQAIGYGQTLPLEGSQELRFEGEGNAPGVLEVGLQDAPHLKETGPAVTDQP